MWESSSEKRAGSDSAPFASGGLVGSWVWTASLFAVLEEKIKQAEDAAERVWLDGISQVQSMLDSGAVAAAPGQV